MALPAPDPLQEPRDPEPPADPGSDSDALVRRVSGPEPLHYSEIGQIETVAAAMRQWPALSLLRALAAKRVA